MQPCGRSRASAADGPMLSASGERELWGFGLNGDEGGILESLGGKEKTGIDVVLFQAGILHQDLLHGGAMGQESQDVLHCEPRAPDDGFADHYFGIYGYPFQQIFIIHEILLDAL
jgi:hypothetical protein